MEYSELNKKAEQYVTKLFNDNNNEGLIFHNIDHTRYVVDRVNEISGNYRLSEKELSILTVAAWFHDTGYLFTRREGHEEKGVEIMKSFFQQQDYDVSIVEGIADCIMATKYPTNPNGLLQQIICDADTYNFGTKDFKSTNKLVFAEINYLKDTNITREAFNLQAYKMLQQHHYYTSYSVDNLSEGKKENMKKLEKKLEIKIAKKVEQAKEAPEFNEDYDPLITEKAGTTKGMQTMLRLTSSNHIKLSDMADSKANILISVNAIIISIILSILLRKLQTDPYLTIPTILFLCVAVTTIVLAILATRPKISLGTFTQEDILSKKTNLLFFGNFFNVDLATYEKAMRTMMRDSDYLYSSMIKDIYFLGVVLGRKYRLLRLAYNIFMIGIIISVMAFAIASIINANTPVPATMQVNNAAGSPF